MNRKTLIIAAVLTAVTFGGVAACAGFDAGDVVHVKTPPTIQQQTGLPSKTSLNEARAEYQAWHQDVQRAGAAWQASIDKGEQVRSLIGQLTLQALDQVGPTIAGVPVLGPLIPTATGLLGLLLGTGRLRKEKESSYNAGLDRGQQLPTPETGPPVVPPPGPRLAT